MAATRCESCPLRLRPGFAPMTPGEARFMQRFKQGEATVEAGAEILSEGADSAHLYTVLEGLGLRFKLLAEGERQVLNFVFPGDFLGLQAGVMGEMRHGVVARTRMTLCLFRREELMTLFRELPARGFDLVWIAAAEERFLGEALAAVGQCDAETRVAWALLRLHQRARAVGLGDERRAPLPFRQRDLADAVGLSLVHTNKTLATLRRKGLASWRDGELRLLDADGLARLARLAPEPAPPRPLI